MSHSKIINAIDIGTTKIVSLVAQHFPQEKKTNVIGVASLPARGIKRGQIVDIDEATTSLVKSIETAERMAGVSIRRAVVGFTAPYIASLKSSGVVAVTEPSKEILANDIARVIEAAKAVALPSGTDILHVIPRQFIVDGQEGIIDPLRMTGVRLEVIASIVTASAAGLKNLRKALGEAGVEVEKLVYSGFSSAEAVLTPTERELGVGLVDVGGTVTSLTVFVEGAPVFVRVIPVGATNVTNDLAIGLRLPLETAEKLKIYLSEHREKLMNNEKLDLFKLGLSAEKGKLIDVDVALNGIMKPRLEEIFQLLKKALQESNLAAAIPAGLVLTGGGSLLPNLAVIAQRTVGLPARLAQPKAMGGIAEEIANPAYSSSLGLIDYYLKDNVANWTSSSLETTFAFLRDTDFRGAAQRLLSIVRNLLP